MQAFTPLVIAFDVMVAPEIASISLSADGACFTTVKLSTFLFLYCLEKSSVFALSPSPGVSYILVME